MFYALFDCKFTERVTNCVRSPPPSPPSLSLSLSFFYSLTTNATENNSHTCCCTHFSYFFFTSSLIQVNLTVRKTETKTKTDNEVVDLFGYGQESERRWERKRESDKKEENDLLRKCNWVAAKLFESGFAVKVNVVDGCESQVFVLPQTHTERRCVFKKRWIFAFSSFQTHFSIVFPDENSTFLCQKLHNFHQ